MGDKTDMSELGDVTACIQDGTSKEWGIERQGTSHQNMRTHQSAAHT